MKCRSFIYICNSDRDKREFLYICLFNKGNKSIQIINRLNYQKNSSELTKNGI